MKNRSSHQRPTRLSPPCPPGTWGIHWPVLGLTALVSLGASFTAQAQRQATATATVLDGVVVAITVTDGGIGYTNAPAVTISGEGGSGATAAAVITNGFVSEVIVLSAGRGYTGQPSVEIAPASLVFPVLQVGVAPRLMLQGTPGYTNQIEYAEVLGPRTSWRALASVVLEGGSASLVDLSENLRTDRFYRARQACVGPGPLAEARARAAVLDGAVVAIEVTDAGTGYTAVPVVTISGGGGSGARAQARIADGAVTEIVVLDAGREYVDSPVVTVAAPTGGAGFGIRRVTRLTVWAAPGTTNEILSRDEPNGGWLTLTNVVVASGRAQLLDPDVPSGMRRSYRMPPPPNPDPSRLVWISRGTFMLGSWWGGQDRGWDEGPVTAVTLTHGVFLGKHEVTQAEYQVVTGNNPSHFQGDAGRPVEQVSWGEAVAYCAKFTDRERVAGRLPAGWVYRLPTEAEWEYAARAGTAARFSWGDDPGYGQLGHYAWYSSNSGFQTHPVGQKQVNPWGLYDMAGNVYEWCADWYAGSYPGGGVSDPTGPRAGSNKVIRGGSWYGDGRDCRSTGRGSDTPGHRSSDIGFRVALAPLP